MSKAINTHFLKKLRIIALIEGTSTLVLFFIAMPLKYYADFPLAVTIVGRLHGVLFLALVLMCVIAIFRVPLGFWWGLAGILSAPFPFAPFLFDLKLKKIT